MAAITRTKRLVSICFPDKAVKFTFIAGETIERGQPVMLNATTKRVMLADANDTARDALLGIALDDAGAGEAVAVLKEGHVYGYTLAGDVGSFAYVGDSVGELADAASASLVLPVGMVIPLSDKPDLTKVLYVDIPWTFRIVADT